MQRLFVRATVGVGLGRIVMVVEGDAGADDVNHGRAVVAQRGLEQFAHLLGVAGEGARHEAAAQDERLHAPVSYTHLTLPTSDLV